MSSEPEEYLAVLKASYDYAPQSEDEIEIKEDQILLLIEKTDDDWWKVKPKGEADGPSGLVPSAYVEKAVHSSLVKAQYDYEAVAQGELSVKEDQTLLAFGAEDDGWLLVQTEDGGKVGYVPANYVEETTGEIAPAATPAAAPRIVIPDSPPRPVRPVSVYTDPADLVAATASKAKADDIKTWSIAELDKKGKKKKGTLGIGNGAIFFASESDKTPVQKWPTGDITSAKIDKTKHVVIEVGGATPISLHYNAGSKDTAEAILTKLESSRGIAKGAADASSPETTLQRSLPPPDRSDIERTASPSKKGTSVHFSEGSPAIIPPRSPSDLGDGDVAQEVEDPDDDSEGDGEEAHALYDFQAQGDDELTVGEGDQLWIIERDGDEWWKCRNVKGDEGVVPASYLEPTGVGRLPTRAATAPKETRKEDDSAEREAEERAREAREAAEAEQERKAQKARAAAAAAAADRKRREQQQARQQKEEEREQREKEREQERKRRDDELAAEERDTHSSSKSMPSRPSSGKKRGSESRKSSEKREPPSRDQTRVWHDRTGQFRVEAAFLGYQNGMIRLHKVNGVVIEVPSEKMSMEDMRVVDKLTKPKSSTPNGASSAKSPADDDDIPLAIRQQSIATPPKKAKPIDWFEFFLNAGCDIDDCTRYASSFERDKIDEAILPDITEGTLRSLGLREGDIIRVMKVIDQRKPKPPSKPDVDALLGNDDSASVQEERKRTTPSPGPPNLFAGPNGAIKNTRRGRPSTSKSTPPASVDLSAISTASEQIQRTTTPQVTSPGGLSAASPVQLPQRTGSALGVSGFDDDAWTPRPSSTRPIAPTPPAIEPRAPSAPPASVAAPAPPAAIVVPVQPEIAIRPQSTTGAPSLAKTTENDIFNQLARLSQLRVASPAVTSGPPSAITPQPSLASPPPASYNAGLGVGRSPVPIGQHLQAQQTGFLPPPQLSNPSPRGPFAPVPANQSLLAPLIPTNTGFNGFVPTRPGASPFQPQQQSFLSAQPTGFPGQQLLPQQTGFPGGTQSQQTGFPGGQQLQSQQTGFPGQQILPQQTGFNTGPLLSQPTGFNGGQFGGFGGAPPVPSFQNNNFGQLQPQPTGFNPGFGQSPYGNNTPPSAPAPKDTSPAGIFAQMKAGTFANDAAPQAPDKYDALRPNPSPLTAQPTGWGYPGFPGGYQGYQ